MLSEPLNQHAAQHCSAAHVHMCGICYGMHEMHWYRVLQGRRSGAMIWGPCQVVGAATSIAAKEAPVGVSKSRASV
jgi:hypothetical protein